MHFGKYCVTLNVSEVQGAELRKYAGTIDTPKMIKSFAKTFCMSQSVGREQ